MIAHLDSPDRLMRIGEAMSKTISICKLFGLMLVGASALLLFSSSSAFSDSLVEVTSQGALGPTDSVVWSNLGGDATSLAKTFSTTSNAAVSVTGTLLAAG